MKKVYRRSYFKLEVDEERQLMVQSWLSYCTSREFRKVQLITVKYFQKYNCKYFISNTTKAGVLDPNDTEWAAEVVTPQLMEAGMEVLNFIVPENQFALMAIRNYEESNRDAFKVKTNIFKSVEDAIEFMFDKSPNP